MKRVTIKDVAEYVGVSTATISYYLNGHFENMSAQMQQTIADAIEKLEYHPNILARNLRTKKTNLIGIVTVGLRGNLAFLGVNGVCEYLNEKGYDTILKISGGSPEKEIEQVKHCLAIGCEGIIIVPSNESNYPFLKSVHESGFPVVLQSRYDPAVWPYDASEQDYESIRELVQLLSQRNCRHIALFIDISKEDIEHASINKKLRRMNYEQEMVHLFGEDCEMEEYYSVTNLETARENIQELIKKYPGEQIAVLAINTKVLISVTKVIRDDKLELVKAGGYSGGDYTDIMTPCEGIIYQPLKEVGIQAARLMVRRLNNPSAPRETVVVPAPLLRMTR